MKPRNIANPSFEVKAVYGLFNQVLVTALKKVTPSFVHGLDCGQLETQMQADANRIKNPVLLTLDGSNHDAHQHCSLIEAIDNYVIRQVIHWFFGKVVMDREMQAEFAAQLLAMKQKWSMYDVSMKVKDRYRKRRVIAEGTIEGTVFSGHPTRTTWGNSLRVICYMRYVAHLAGMQESDYAVMVAGDDVSLTLNADHAWSFITALRKQYLQVEPKKRVVYGLGQVAKDIWLARNRVDFLSKIGIVIPGLLTTVQRPFDRAIIGANNAEDSKVGKTITIAQHNAAVTLQLKSWVSLEGMPVLSEYIVWREKNLKHDFMGAKQTEQWNKVDRNVHVCIPHLYMYLHVPLASYEHSVEWYDNVLPYIRYVHDLFPDHQVRDIQRDMR